MHQVMHTFYLLGNYYGTVTIGTVLVGSDGKESACSAGDLGSISGLGRTPGEGNGNPLQYSCLVNTGVTQGSVLCPLYSRIIPSWL